MVTEAAIFTIVLVAVTILVSYRGFSEPAFRARYLFDSRRIYPGRETIRLLSSGFLHADWIHLGLNMWALFLFGGALERVRLPGTGEPAGALFLLTVYFAGMLGGNLLSLALHLGKPHYALGASGGVSGLVLAYVFLFPGATLFVFPIPVPIPGWLFAIGFIAVSILGVRLRAGGIGHDAHLGGALIGLLTATAFQPQIFTEHQPLFFTVMLMAAGFLVSTLRGGTPRPRPVRVVRVRRRTPAQPPKPDLSEFPEGEDREAVIDLLLEKISRGGMESLTAEERMLLEKLSQEHPE